jgi:hypothetical protein
VQAQLTLYLRLNGASVPGIYGPSAVRHFWLTAHPWIRAGEQSRGDSEDSRVALRFRSDSPVNSQPLIVDLEQVLAARCSVIVTVPLAPSSVAVVEVGKLLGCSAEISEQSA